MSHDLMEVVNRLRPEPVRPDEDWSARELDRILATPQRRRRRRWTIPVAAGVGVAALVGGAYAGGFVPHVVVERLGQGDRSDPINRIGEVREVFSLTLADGRRAQLFVAPNDAGGQCWTLPTDLDAETEPEDLSYTCDSNYPGVESPGPWDKNGFGVEWVDDGDGPAILYGDASYGFRLPEGTMSVHVTGPDFEWTSEIDGAEGWAVELPDRRIPDRTSFRVDFLDASGKVLRTSTGW